MKSHPSNLTLIFHKLYFVLWHRVSNIAPSVFIQNEILPKICNFFLKFWHVWSHFWPLRRGVSELELSIMFFVTSRSSTLLLVVTPNFLPLTRYYGKYIIYHKNDHYPKSLLSGSRRLKTSPKKDFKFLTDRNSSALNPTGCGKVKGKIYISKISASPPTLFLLQLLCNIYHIILASSYFITIEYYFTQTKWCKSIYVLCWQWLHFCLSYKHIYVYIYIDSLAIWNGWHADGIHFICRLNAQKKQPDAQRNVFIYTHVARRTIVCMFSLARIICLNAHSMFCENEIHHSRATQTIQHEQCNHPFDYFHLLFCYSLEFMFLFVSWSTNSYLIWCMSNGTQNMNCATICCIPSDRTN